MKKYTTNSTQQTINLGKSLANKFKIKDMGKLEKSIHKKIQNIKAVYDINKILNFKIDNEYIKKYYWINKVPYSIFHSKEGYVHFSVNKNGNYNKDGLTYQPKFIADYIRKTKANDILEIACGRAANLIYLAKGFPKVNLFGIDLSQGQLDYTYQKVKKYNNLKVEEGDYHNLTRFNNETFNIVFIIEALCYSTNKKQVLKGVKRILKPNGLFIIIDGYWRESKNPIIKNEKIIKRLAELGMALDKFEKYSQIKKYATEINFKTIEEQNLIQFLLPNAEKYENITRKVIERKYLMHAIKRLFPKKFVYNTFFGYLIADAIRDRWVKYIVSVFKKQ